MSDNFILASADRDMLSRLLGTAEVPAKIQEEAVLRTRMMHRVAAGQPLGPSTLIDIIRFCGEQSPDAAPMIDRKVDWSKFADDGSVAVEAYFEATEGWHAASFRGMSDQGLVVVKLDGDKWLREVTPSNCRLPRLDGAKKAQASLPPKSAPVAAKTLEEQYTGPRQGQGMSPPGADIPEVVFSDADRGAAVMVESDNDVLDGVFVGMAELDGHVMVQVEKEPEPRVFSVEDVFKR